MLDSILQCSRQPQKAMCTLLSWGCWQAGPAQHPATLAGSKPLLAVCTSDKNISSSRPLSKQLYVMVDKAFKPVLQPSSTHSCSPPLLHPNKFPNLFFLHGENEVCPPLQAMTTPWYLLYITLAVLHILMNVGILKSWGQALTSLKPAQEESGCRGHRSFSKMHGSNAGRSEAGRSVWRSQQPFSCLGT